MDVLVNRFSTIILSHILSEYNVPGDRRTLRARIIFIDESRLILHESFFYDTGRTKYSYQWMNEMNELVHRWDNAHPVSLPTSPHHQHVGSEENIQPSEPMTLEKVLTHIASGLLPE